MNQTMKTQWTVRHAVCVTGVHKIIDERGDQESGEQHPAEGRHVFPARAVGRGDDADAAEHEDPAQQHVCNRTLEHEHSDEREEEHEPHGDQFRAAILAPGPDGREHLRHQEHDQKTSGHRFHVYVVSIPIDSKAARWRGGRSRTLGKRSVRAAPTHTDAR